MTRPKGLSPPSPPASASGDTELVLPSPTPSADTPTRIAIVDDMEPNALLLAAMLETLPGTQVSTFTKAEAALACCLDTPPDLVLVDYRMPDLDGLGFTRRLRAAPSDNDLPILMITADDSTATLRDAFAAGVTDFLRKPVDEVELTARCLNMLRLRLRTRALVEANNRLRHLANHDALTGVTNRRRFLEIVVHEIDRAARYGHPLSIIALDLDRFKGINDSLGHAAGDAALVSGARALTATCRTTDVIGRIGGEEFMVLLPDTPLPQAAEAAERLRQAIAIATVEHANTAFRITASLGVAQWTPPTEPLEALLHRADEAMYRAKADGRNQMVVAAPSVTT